MIAGRRLAAVATIALAAATACTPAPERAANEAPPAAASAREVSFEAADGLRVFGDLYECAKDRHAPILLLFHQAGGDARGEYGPIAPRLVEAGYHVLAVDQRVGGNRFGGTNRTMAGVEAKDLGYCDAYPDLEAALAWAAAEGFDGPRVAWGSSYSAALVLRLAAAHGDELAGVLAFSTALGEPMKGCDPGESAPRVTIPVLALRPSNEAKAGYVREQVASFEKLGFRTFTAEHGAHGSSMLVASRVDGDVEPTWREVLGFLAGLSAPARPA